ncbi:uncharacterized protein RAG0_03081 [Rhynchosporium agropyri]|uniref:DUF7908 domain-containing protein n=1 Tax=Rhynchosporium agropyri TaxID=914238 RepID=A0A1E1K2Y7_9HELO|nr:uncharacterized protein RAG0_03081 [Rhynchosporium agropyri]
MLKTVFSFIALLALVVEAIPSVLQRDLGCAVGNGGPGGVITQITVVNVVRTRVVVFPIIINTFIQQNTVLNFQGGVTIIVTNAPTRILTIATGSSIATNTIATTVLPGNIQVFQTTNIINFPVIISTFIQQNTIIQGGGGVNIVITNAPTHIFTTAIGTSTVTATVTNTITTNDSVPTAFILAPVAVASVRRSRRARRQISGPQYISPAGDIVARCSNAQVFTITNGQLSSEGSFLSVNRGVGSAPFVTAQAINDISTTFSISDTLEWSNPAFSGGRARFCSQNGRVNALFTLNATLADCTIQNLFVIPAAACVDGVIISSSSTPSASTNTPVDSSPSSTFVPFTTTSPSQSESSSPFPSFSSEISADASTTSISGSASDSASPSLSTGPASGGLTDGPNTSASSVSSDVTTTSTLSGSSSGLSSGVHLQRHLQAL